MELRPYQHKAGEAIEAEFFDAGKWRIIATLATGLGKTVIFSRLPSFPRIAAWLQQFPPADRRMLVIAHREELLDQAAEKLRAAHPQAMVSIEQGDRYANRFSSIVVASVQTLASTGMRRLDRLTREAGFRIVVVDEAHHAASVTYRKVLARLGFIPEPAEDDDAEDGAALLEKLDAWDKRSTPDRLLVGVTATPNRSDAVGLSCVFQGIAFQYGIKEGIQDGWLTPIVPYAYGTDTSLEQVKKTAGEFNQKDLAVAVNTPERNALAVNAWKACAEGLPTLAFTVDIKHAHALAEVFQRAGVRAAAVSGETPREERRQILQDYRDGRYTVLCNAMLLTEGTDLPLTACILHAKPTASATLYTQMTGRGLRLHPGKAHCVVIDLVDVTTKHSLQAAPALYGLPPLLKTDGKTMRQLEDDLATFREEFPGIDIDKLLEKGAASLDDLRAQARRVDLWAVQSLGPLAQHVTQNWIAFGEDCYRLSYPWADGHETLEVRKDILGHFEITCTLRPSDHAKETRQRTLAHDVPTVVEALRVAEVFVSNTRQQASKLTDKNARWRGDPVTEGQLRILKKLKVPVVDRSAMTKGRASDLITRAKAMRGWR